MWASWRSSERHKVAVSAATPRRTSSSLPLRSRRFRFPAPFPHAPLATGSIYNDRMTPMSAMLGPYRLLEFIATAAWDVWHAVGLRLGRSIEIKVLTPDVAADREAIARMRREAWTALQPNYSNS